MEMKAVSGYYSIDIDKEVTIMASSLPYAVKKGGNKKKIENPKGASKGKYDVETLRKNMSTGGGEPIDKGKKWTNEKRRLQPRDPDTGHFTYNADAQYGLKYKQRAGKAVPLAARDWVMNGVIKKGDVMNINDKTFIAIETIDADKLKDFFSRFNEEKGDYQSSDGKLFSEEFQKKKGRMSKSEKEGIAQGKLKVGEVDLSKVSQSTIDKIDVQIKANHFPESTLNSIPMANIGLVKLTNNQAWNATHPTTPSTGANAPKPSAPSQKPAGVGVASGSENPSGQPSKSNTLVGGINEAKADPNKFYNDNKATFDLLADAMGDESNPITGQDVVQYYVNGDITDADISGLFE